MMDQGAKMAIELKPGRASTVLVLAALLLPCLGPGIAAAQSHHADLEVNIAGEGDGSNLLNRLAKITCRLDFWGTDPGPNLYADVWIEDPQGTPLVLQHGQTYSTHLVVMFTYEVPELAMPGTYSCHATLFVDTFRFGDISATVEVGAPASIVTIQEGFVQYAFGNYQFRRFYQTLDSGGAPWTYDDATVRETFGAWITNTCQLGTIQPRIAETDVGTFSDFFAFSNVPRCNTHPNCQSRILQTIKVGGYQVRQHTLTYRCNGVIVP